MFAKSVVYDKQRWSEEQGLTEPITVFNFGRRKFDVRAYRYIRVEWESERVFGSNTDTEAEADWQLLPAMELPPEA
jgi:hypothetical protein